MVQPQLWLSGLLGVGDLAAIALLFYNAIAVGEAGLFLLALVWLLLQGGLIFARILGFMTDRPG